MLYSFFHILHMGEKSFLYLIHSYQVVLVGMWVFSEIFNGSIVSQRVDSR